MAQFSARRHWLFVQRSRVWAVARSMRRLLAGSLPPNVNQITDQLYVGGFIDLHDWAALYARNITVVINLQAERHDRFGLLIPDGYLWLPTMDHAAPDLQALATGVAFARAALAEQKQVLIHCHAGMGRSALLCTATLVAEGMSPDDAWALVKARRPIAQLHPWQRQALEAFASSLKEQQ